jgi:DNA mismatch repair protein MutS2
VPQGLRKGDKVRVLSLGGMTGEVLADSDDEEAIVQVGAMRVTVPLSALRAEKRAAEPISVAVNPPRGGNNGSSASLALSKAATISSEISLIAQRVDVALPRLDKYLDDAYAAGITSARIIHGKGTGMLRKAVWDFLKDDARIASYQLAHPDEGGAGATVVRFQE